MAFIVLHNSKKIFKNPSTSTWISQEFIYRTMGIKNADNDDNKLLELY